MRKTSILRSPMKLLGGGSLLLAALLMGQQALAQIVTSKHDLTSATGTGGYKTSSTTDVCVFCHTPHGASTAAPLWNKGAPAGPFTLYSSATLDSTLLAVGSISLACLSCHDGVSGLDNMINAPGSGGYNAAGASQSYTWTAGSNSIGPGITQIGISLVDDHPVGAAYCAGFTGAGVCKDPDFNLAQLNRLPVGGAVTHGSGAAVTTGALTDQYWIDNTALGTGSVRDKTDVILYTRAFATPAGNFPSVECGSCHDPHSTTNGTFLRMANTASALCTTCHNK